MIKKRVLGIVSVCVLSLSMLVGCGNPVTDELTDFVNSASSPAMKTMMDGLAAPMDDNLESDEAVMKAINDVTIPKMEEAQKVAESVTPTTDEVKALQSELVEIVKGYKEAYTTMAGAIEARDTDKLNTSSEQLATINQKVNDYKDHLDSVAAENDVTLE